MYLYLAAGSLGLGSLSWPHSHFRPFIWGYWGDWTMSSLVTSQASRVVCTVVAVFRKNERSIQGLLRSNLRLVQCHFCHICSLEQVTVPAPSQGDDENRICLLMAKHFSKGKDIRREIPGPFCNSWPYDITYPLLHRL